MGSLHVSIRDARNVPRMLAEQAVQGKLAEQAKVVQAKTQQAKVEQAKVVQAKTQKIMDMQQELQREMRELEAAAAKMGERPSGFGFLGGLLGGGAKSDGDGGDAPGGDGGDGVQGTPQGSAPPGLGQSASVDGTANIQTVSGGNLDA